MKKLLLGLLALSSTFSYGAGFYCKGEEVAASLYNSSGKGIQEELALYYERIHPAALPFQNKVNPTGYLLVFMFEISSQIGLNFTILLK